MVPKINSSLRIVTFSIMHIQCASARVPCSYFYRNVKERLIEQDFKKVELSFFCNKFLYKILPQTLHPACPFFF
jgi:hypothetical protein